MSRTPFRVHLFSARSDSSLDGAYRSLDRAGSWPEKHHRSVDNASNLHPWTVTLPCRARRLRLFRSLGPRSSRRRGEDATSRARQPLSFFPLLGSFSLSIPMLRNAGEANAFLFNLLVNPLTHNFIPRFQTETPTALVSALIGIDEKGYRDSNVILLISR